MAASLIVTTYNRPDALALVLAAATNQTVPPTEILVADDGSGPETGELVRRLAAGSATPIRHLWQEDQGFRAARCRNMAIAAATGDYLIFIDGDMVPTRDFVADHLQMARPGCFVQGSRVLVDQKATARVLKEGWRESGLFSPGLGNRKNLLRFPLLARILLHPSTSDHGIRTCNFACWRRDAIAVNGFNEDFHGWGREDSEFAVRLLNAGAKRINLKFMARAFHLHHPEAEREKLAANDAILEQARIEKKTRCDRGVNLHLQGEEDDQG